MIRLHIAVRLLAGRYHGEEWPPGPARLVQALIGAGRTGRNRLDWSAADEEALKWLEQLDPPVIRTGRFRQELSYRLFVPDNESDKAAAAALEGGRFDISRYRTPKAVQPRLMLTADGKPDVLYTWTIQSVAEAERHAPALARLARKLYALGWGIDLACADAAVSAAEVPELGETFAPSAAGTPLRVPADGFAADVMRSWEAFRDRITPFGVNPYTKATSYGIQNYRRATDLPRREMAAFRLETPDGEPFSWPWEEAPVVAAWLRHATAAALREERFEEARIAAEVLGHGESDKAARISYVPAPSIGHMYSDGAIRRVMLVGSLDMDGEIIDLLRVKLASRALTEAGTGRPRARLVPLSIADRGVLSVYTTESDTWSTVTPVILHGFNTSHRKLSQAKTERLLLQAFVNSGYPETLIREVAFRPACSWSGPGAAISIRVPQHLERWPRYHVWVRFAPAVRGPVLAGIGRHYGLGLFASRRR